MVDILSRLEKLEKENSDLKKEVSVLNKYADFCDEKIFNLEKQMNHIDQYIRRENIVITCIPDSVREDDLEGKVMEVIHSVDVDIGPSDIVVCHRLSKTNGEIKKKNSSKVIVRFINRKKVSSCLKNKNKLGETYKNLGYNKNLYIQGCHTLLKT